MKIPTNEDWGDYKQDLDTEYAYKIFAGKSNADVVKYFALNVIERTDELRFMPIIPFQYYMLGFQQYVMTIEFGSENSPDAVSCFMHLIEEKLSREPQFITPIMSELYPVIQHITNHQSDYDADVKIYGDFTKILEKISVLYLNSKNQRIL